MSGTMRDCEDDEDEAEWLDERRESKDMRDAPLLMIELSESERTCSGSRKRDMVKAGEVGDEGVEHGRESLYVLRLASSSRDRAPQVIGVRGPFSRPGTVHGSPVVIDVSAPPSKYSTTPRGFHALMEWGEGQGTMR
jgi:hypothetical protein